MCQIIYYVTMLLSVIIYCFGIKKHYIKLVSYTSIMYVSAFFLVMLPGYEISAGNYVDLGHYRGIDNDLYILYLAYSLITPVGLLIGNKLGARLSFRMAERKTSGKVLWLILLFILVYSLMYFRWLPEIPINNIIRGGDALSQAILRVAITHQNAEMEGLPIYFRYARNILQPWFLIVFIVITLDIVNSQHRSSLTRCIFFVMFCYLVYCFIFTLEKAPALTIILSLFMVYFIRNSVSLFKILYALLAIICMASFMVLMFMGAEVKGPGDLLLLVINRLAEQSSSTYIQIEYIRAHGFLLFSGFKMPIINNLFNMEVVDLSKWAYSEIFPYMDRLGVTGAAGGMSLAQLYFCFSWFSIPIYLCFTVIYGLTDILLLNSIEYNKSSARLVNINVAFYSVISAYYSLAIVSSVFTLFSIPTIFNPSILFILILYFIIIKITSVSVVYVSKTLA